MTRLTKEQAVLVTAYTGILCSRMADFHEYAEQVLERPIFTHEFASKETWAELKAATRDDFKALCPEDAS